MLMPMSSLLAPAGARPRAAANRDAALSYIHQAARTTYQDQHPARCPTQSCPPCRSAASTHKTAVDTPQSMTWANSWSTNWRYSEVPKRSYYCPCPHSSLDIQQVQGAV